MTKLLFNAEGQQRLESFDAYDQLPKRLQLMLAHFPQKQSSEFALKKLRQGMSEDALCTMLEGMRERFTTEGVPPLDPESHYRSKPLRRNPK